jgi:hypothetical protein
LDFWLGEKSEMKIAAGGPGRIHLCARLVLPVLLAFSFGAASTRAGGINLPQEAAQALEKMYGGDPDGAIALLHTYEATHPDDPLPYTIEAEARWWKIFCDAAEIKWGMVDSQKRGKKPDDESYLALADRVIQFAQARTARQETSESHLYAGIGYALKTRLYGLRNENRIAARNGVAARTEFLRALELDPDNADATTGLGFYNYYVDTLSTVVKILRFFMGIPGGNKVEGEKQIRVGVEHGVLLAVDARFYLARNLRTYEQKYQDALDVAGPLVTRHPQNPVFLLLVGNLNIELGRNAKAAEYFNGVMKLPAVAEATAGCAGARCDPCPAHVRILAQTFLDSIR